jgi:alginate O-acetyltransferase complex protein AlgI
MIFNSVTYLLFLLIVVALFWLLPRKPRLIIIFLSSIIFYGFWRVEFIPVMLLSVVTDYIAAIKISQSSKASRIKWLYFSLCINFGLLFYFKYLLFFAENTIGLLSFFDLQPEPLLINIILPLGISFYTFQTISYTVDVYRGFIKPERDFVLYGCYVTFFPQLVAGPILRAAEVIPQLNKRAIFQWHNIIIGTRRILYGLFLKVVLADNIAPLVDAGYAISTSNLSALDVWTLAFLFGFQIYFDFCAYSHIALGSAKLMGINFPENFNFPYMAVSPKDFWRRWHISLSSWIRDYLYLPLTGTKVHDRSVGGLGAAVATKKKNQALFFTWALMGLWHGASWTFVVWGLFHASFIFFYRLCMNFLTQFSDTTRNVIGWLITLPIVMLSWIPFRAQSLEDAFSMWAILFSPTQYTWLGMRENTYLLTAILLIGIMCSFFVKTRLLLVISKLPILLLLSESILFTIVIALVFIYLRPISQFIYFQF